MGPFPTEAEIDAWKAASTPVYEGYKAKSGDLGAQVLKAAEGL
jgi:C4-dicarboxylate-binding protein DctP